MTMDGFSLSKVVLNFFVYSVTFCQPELALQLMMGFNPDLTQMLMVNSYCFWGCLPLIPSLQMGNILINLTGLSQWDNRKLPLRRL